MTDEDATTPEPNAPDHQFTLSSYEPVTITLPVIDVPDSAVDEQLLKIAEGYASYEKIEDREIRPTDALLLAVSATENGEPFPGLTTDGRVVQLGQNLMPDEFEQQVASMSVGETKTFDFEGPTYETGEDGMPIMSKVTATVTVLEIQQPIIPAITDIWVSANIPGAKTVPEFREMLKKQMASQMAPKVEEYKYFQCASALAQRLEGRIPDDLFEKGMAAANASFEAALAQQKMTKQEFLEKQGMDQNQFDIQLLMQARQMIAQQEALGALADHLKIEVTDEDINAVFGGKTAEQNAAARKACEEAGQLDDARKAAQGGKALKWLVDTAKIEYK
ncbi:MAG: hypothetical protein HGA39_08515 [Coriobacteriia bacterium]|nr:hypothetical protein [Coriobacteriia bacterium]